MLTSGRVVYSLEEFENRYPGRVVRFGDIITDDQAPHKVGFGDTVTEDQAPRKVGRPKSSLQLASLCTPEPLSQEFTPTPQPTFGLSGNREQTEIPPDLLDITDLLSLPLSKASETLTVACSVLDTLFTEVTSLSWPSSRVRISCTFSLFLCF